MRTVQRDGAIEGAVMRFFKVEMDGRQEKWTRIGFWRWVWYSLQLRWTATSWDWNRLMRDERKRRER